MKKIKPSLPLPFPILLPHQHDIIPLLPPGGGESTLYTPALERKRTKDNFTPVQPGYLELIFELAVAVIQPNFLELISIITSITYFFRTSWSYLVTPLTPCPSPLRSSSSRPPSRTRISGSSWTVSTSARRPPSSLSLRRSRYFSE